jgi:hypothetical protein
MHSDISQMKLGLTFLYHHLQQLPLALLMPKRREEASVLTFNQLSEAVDKCSCQKLTSKTHQPVDDDTVTQ